VLFASLTGPPSQTFLFFELLFCQIRNHSGLAGSIIIDNDVRNWLDEKLSGSGKAGRCRGGLEPGLD
jgi:hypothetical protein